jgi:hypothetical protein
VIDPDDEVFPIMLNQMYLNHYAKIKVERRTFTTHNLAWL